MDSPGTKCTDTEYEVKNPVDIDIPATQDAALAKDIKDHLIFTIKKRNGAADLYSAHLHSSKGNSIKGPTKKGYKYHVKTFNFLINKIIHTWGWKWRTELAYHDLAQLDNIQLPMNDPIDMSNDDAVEQMMIMSSPETMAYRP